MTNHFPLVNFFLLLGIILYLYQDYVWKRKQDSMNDLLLKLQAELVQHGIIDFNTRDESDGT